MTKEKIESEMLLIQLERIKIRDERNLIINQLQNVTGEKYKRKKIPDFIKKKKNIIKLQKIHNQQKKIQCQMKFK